MDEVKTKKNHRSISQTVKRAGDRSYRAKLCKEWALDWRDEQWAFLDEINHALKVGDIQEAIEITRDFRNHLDRRTESLPKLFDMVAEPKDFSRDNPE